MHKNGRRHCNRERNLEIIPRTSNLPHVRSARSSPGRSPSPPLRPYFALEGLAKEGTDGASEHGSEKASMATSSSDFEEHKTSDPIKMSVNL